MTMWRCWLMAVSMGTFGVGLRAERDVLLDAVTPMAAAPVARAAVVEQSHPATVAAVPSAHVVARGQDGLFYVHADVNGRPIRFLVDTGASVVVLTAADAKLAGIEPADEHYRNAVETVGGSTPMSWATMANVRVAGHHVRDVRAVVVRNGLGVSLLGQNMLAELDSVTISSDRLTLR